MPQTMLASSRQLRSLLALAVASLGKEVREQRADIAHDLRAPRVARQHHLLLRREIPAPAEQTGLTQKQRLALLLVGGLKRALHRVKLVKNLSDHTRFTSLLCRNLSAFKHSGVQVEGFKIEFFL